MLEYAYFSQAYYTVNTYGTSMVDDAKIEEQLLFAVRNSCYNCD